jgi:hypothetical protein
MAALRTLLWLTVVLGGCKAEFFDRPSIKGELVGQIWTLREMKGQAAGRGDPPSATLRFLDNHRIAGTTDCNDVFSEDYRWSTDTTGTEGGFRPGMTGQTADGCGTGTMIGKRFWHDMADARGWSIRGDRLTIRFSDGGQAVLMRTGPFVVTSPDCSAGSTDFDCTRRGDQGSRR